MAYSPLIHSVIGCLTQTNVSCDLHDASTECLVNAFQLIDDKSIAPQQQKLAQVLQQGVIHTVDAFQSAIRDEDSDKYVIFIYFIINLISLDFLTTLVFTSNIVRLFLLKLLVIQVMDLVIYGH